MPRDRRRFLRRDVLLKAAGGTAVTLGLGAAVTSTGAFTSVTGERSSAIEVAKNSEALIGIVGRGPVKKNTRESMVELYNNTAEQVSITVTLRTCSDGVLYDNVDESGCSVTFSLLDGASKFVDIEAAVKGTIPYSISASGDEFSLQTTYQVEAESGNVIGAVRIRAPSKDKAFSARASQDEWRISKVDVRDDDGDADLDYIEYEVVESGAGGTVVATKRTEISGGRYKAKNVSILPDDSGYSIQRGQTYTLRMRAYDADGNYAATTLQTTA